ncbi:hypothetical protein BDR04DRAFT_1127553 [Suillus decipiens]|nr:hypothetical protein BDR04DRAFT_1127553 [Suillus decipiens]
MVFTVLSAASLPLPSATSSTTRLTFAFDRIVVFTPYREYSTNGEECHYRYFMSGDWAWDQVDQLSKDPDMMGTTFVPLILGSDKMTISIGTGNNEYYLLYLSIGNIHNNVQHAHWNAVSVIGFLAMPKTTKEHTNDMHFRKFRHQLFHSSLSKVLERLRPRMAKPEVVKFADGHFCRVIYSLRPYIADYEEQVLLTCIVHFWCPQCMAPNVNLDAVDTHPRCQEYIEELIDIGTYLELWDEFGIITDLVPFTNDFPRADICQLIMPDILHQLVKGTFKDHLVDWSNVQFLLYIRIAAVAFFAGLWHFLQGHGFKQWTRDDSKALMKVYLAAIEGHVPVEIVHTFCAFLEFCYLVCQNAITECTLEQIQDAVLHFHKWHEIFLESGTISIKHIKAVKGPWRWSSKYNALSQMLLTNQQLDKLAAARVDFTSRGMLNGTCLSAALKALCNELSFADDAVNDAHNENLNASVPEDDVDGVDYETKCAHTLLALTEELNIPHLPEMIHRFLFQQTCPGDPQDASEIPLAGCP